MKKNISLTSSALFITLSVVTIFISCGAIFSQVNQNFTVSNESGVTVTAFYISPSGSNNWSNNLINKDSVNTGGTFEFSQTIDQGQGQSQNQSQDNCNYDLKFTGKNKKDYIMHNVDLCRSKSFSIFNTGDVMKSDIEKK